MQTHTHPDPWAPGVFDFIGGALCLDFANTLAAHEPVIDEHLPDYAALAAWATAARLVDEPEARRLAAQGGEDPATAAALLARAHALRSAIFRLVHADEDALDADLAVVNAELRAGLPRLAVAVTVEGFDWRWAARDQLDFPLGPVALSTARLLTDSPRLARVRECGGDRCQWLFIDSSRNGRRRWCDMAACGNRAKQKRHYERTRVQPGARGQ